MSDFQDYDLVQETTTTTGTGPLTLLGAVTGFQSFGVVGDGVKCKYAIQGFDPTTGKFTGIREVGQGTYTLSGTTLSRDKVESSNNGGALVNLPAGTYIVSLVKSAASLNSVIALGSNTTGSNVTAANLNIQAPLGTGNAASGSIVFKTGAVGSSGSTQQTPTTALTLDNSQNGTFAKNLTAPGVCTLGTASNSTTSLLVGNGSPSLTSTGEQFAFFIGQTNANDGITLLPSGSTLNGAGITANETLTLGTTINKSVYLQTNNITRILVGSSNDGNTNTTTIYAYATSTPAVVIKGIASLTGDFLELQDNTAAVLAKFDSGGNAVLPHIGGISGTPSIAAGAGAGSSPTVSVSGNDVHGVVNVTTGTLPTASAVVATITFAKTYNNAPQVVLFPANANADLLDGVTAITTTDAAGNFAINVGSIALAAATTYQWKYHTLGN
jgi:hypothetical protein